jgi:tetratricopeptide (TPR) repeat protein
MNPEFLARLVQAQTEEEKDWLLTELSLSVLSPELRAMTLAAAVPHWFDVEILAALQPDLARQAEELYVELQNLSFVEVFPEKGHNIHDRTRNTILKHLWETDAEAYRQLSQYLVEYFAGDGANLVEEIYHKIAADFEAGSSKFEDCMTNLDHNFRRGEAEALLAAMQEQVEAKRVPDKFAADVVYWFGKIHFRFYEAQDALDRYNSALTLYEQVGDKLGKANTLKAIGDVLQFLKRCDEALDRYNSALTLYEQVGAKLGKANTLTAIGDVASAKEQYSEALAYYHQALALVEQIQDSYSTARVWYYIGKACAKQGDQPEAIAAFTTATTIFRKINLEDLAVFCEGAIEEIEESDRL